MMLKMAAAMLASTLAMSGYNIADTFFVGHIAGTAPLAAMGFTFPIIMLIGCLFAGFGSGCNAIMAQAIGAGDHKGANRVVTSGLLLLVIISLVLALLGVTCAEWLYMLMGAKGEALAELRRYMDVWFLGCVTASIQHPGNHMIITAGRTKTAAAVTILGMLVNVILDPLMIFGGQVCRDYALAFTPEATHVILGPIMNGLSFLPAWGIQGAAIATVASQAVSTTLILIILKRLQLLTFDWIPLAVLGKTWRHISSYAIPAILGMMVVPITNYVTTWVTAGFGDTMVAATAAASRMEHVCFVLPMAFGIPLMSVLAQNYGAKLYDRVRYAFWFASIIAFAFLVIAAVVLFCFAEKLVVFFSPVPEVQTLMVRYMHIIPWGFGLLELTRYAGFALTGCAHPKLDAALKTARMLLILIPLSLLAWAIKWQDGVFYARLVADALGGCICFAVAAVIVQRLK